MSKCGNPKCGTSTGIHEGLTFGHGRLDHHGYWEFPCRTCAADWDSRIVETRQRVRDDQIARGVLPLNAIQYVLKAEWLHLRAWPLAKTDLEEHAKEMADYWRREDEQNLEFEQLFGYSNDGEGEAA